MTTPELAACDDCNCSLKILPQEWVGATLKYFTIPQEKQLLEQPQGEDQ